MRRVVTVFVFLLSSFILNASADWVGIANRVEQSIVIVNNTEGLCTGFIINAERKEEKDKPSTDLILTAAHCYGANLYADQEPAKVIHKDEKKDLMVLEVADTGRPALLLAKDDPRVGEEVGSYGFGYGTVMDRAIFRTAHISAKDLFIAADGIGGPLLALDATFVPGQSGGPVVNSDGEVVMIVQMGTGTVGMGVGADVIGSKVGRYWEKQKQKP